MSAEATHRDAAMVEKPRALTREQCAQVRLGYCLCGSTLLLRGPSGYAGANYLCLACHREFHKTWAMVLLLHELCPDERVKGVYRVGEGAWKA